MTYPQSDLASGAGLYTEHIQGGATIAAYSVVYIDAAGQWQAADADAVATMPVVGLATESLRANQKGKVLQQGYASLNTWAWTPGGLLYASTTAGALTHTPPAGPGDVIQEIGYAVSATMIYFDGSGFGSSSTGGGTLLAGATAYVGSEATLAGYTNYFYTGDYANHTLLLAAAVDYVGVLGGGSISLEAMTFDGRLIVDENEVLVFGQGWDTIINEVTETGNAIQVTAARCVIRDLQCGTAPNGGNAYSGIVASGSGTNLLIDNVYVNGSDYMGIELNAAKGKITNCFIFNVDNSGIYLNAGGDEGIVSNNRILTADADGITIHASAENCVVNGNNISGWTTNAIGDSSGTAAIGNDNWAGAGSYETQAGGAWVDPTVTAGGVWAGRMIQVYNSNIGAYRTYVYLNGGWRYVALT